ncbi:PqqD family protein [Microbacterium azadirachtae]|uniref:Coenzyme PQQ synthesis protein D (PqqD) n=1 Tax=Microbacterium azadirachtae TaxID=582680 RepID=A0A0F0L1T3_9MICO|nr:PqqD family protein [Microbacterium azadirachtae]KJL26320.1 Coenzyme PQQ synthesis protein D (PqqD) [Microbacterium azadirachtae]UXW85252.1 PqqD family protein [Microbacterium azadirachtae]SDM43289.1 Coenzyme PQQ synthesis protein D (PqqD) [Microbacterium azadirachtae]SEG57189.1 Coenzyme PQQ synthesis protein D (PqqD) [Microbacterium azadirachtae]SEG60138.1 Coenzyme PQQ synthesis protein D (PqqD) [Microbacterium azadirachtae]
MGGDQSGPWRIADAVAWTTSGNEVVALELESPTSHPMTLQGTAAYVWEEIDANGPLSSAELITNVAAAYEVSEDAIRDDILALLDGLLAQHLIAH